MSRVTIVLVTVAISTLVSGLAEAGRFCLKWKATYADSGFGEDRLSDGSPTSSSPVQVPANYTRVRVVKNLFTTVFDGYINDTDGCTPVLTMASGDSFNVIQWAHARRMRDLNNTLSFWALEWGDHWGSTNLNDTESYSRQLTLLYTPRSTEKIYLGVAAPDANSSANAMPVVMEMLAKAQDLDWTDSEMWLSTDPTAHTPLQDGCTFSFMSHDDTTGNYYVCVGGDLIERKYNIAHEIGHALAFMNYGPMSGDHRGDKGMFNATGVDNRCDCTLVGGVNSHCPTSREFTGDGQREGFAHFMAAVTMNDLDTGGEGVWVPYHDLMEPTEDHYDDFTSLLEDPDFDTDVVTPSPLDIDLDPASRVKWIEYECDPSGGDFVHYGTQWDWLDFYWGLWTDATDAFSADEINEIWESTRWNGLPDRAYFCCDVDTDSDPTACDPRDKPEDCDAGTNTKPARLGVGYLWTADPTFEVNVGVLDRTQVIYASDPDKYDLFEETGENTKVNY
jgi:hypothetical protein